MKRILAALAIALVFTLLCTGAWLASPYIAQWVDELFTASYGGM